MTVKREIQDIADALMSLRIGDKNCEFYKRYEASGLCMYEFALVWLQEES